MSGSQDKKIKIWDVRSKRLIQHYDAHADTVNQIAVHPSGFYMLSASNDAKVKVWDLRQGRLIYTLYAHDGASTAVSFSAGGDYFVSGGVDNRVLVWKSNFEEKAGEFINELPSPTKPSPSKRSSPLEGTRFAESSKKRTSTATKDKRSSSAVADRTKLESSIDPRTLTFSPEKTGTKGQSYKSYISASGGVKSNKRESASKLPYSSATKSTTGIRAAENYGSEVTIKMEYWLMFILLVLD